MPVTPQRIHKPMPIKGRRTSWPPDMMGDDFSPDCLNVRFRFGEVRPTPGRNVLAGPATNQNPLWIGQFPQLDGTVWAVMLTTTRMYRWGDSTPGTPRQWCEVLCGDVTPVGTSRWSVAVGEGKMFFGRIEDRVYFWTGVSTDTFKSIQAQAGVQGITGGATVPKARYLEYFNNRLILAFTVEGANTLGNRIRWPENGNFLHWDETLGLGAGFLDLAEGGQEPIRGMRSFGSGGRCFVSTRTTVKELVATGTLDPVHVEQLRVRAFGCDAPYTVSSNGQAVFFLGYDRKVYSWDGVRLTPIGEGVFEEIHAITSPANMNTYFSALSTQRQEYWLIIPPSDAFVYDYARDYWTRDTVPGFTAMGEVDDTEVAPRWVDMTTTWDTETRTWEMLRGASSTVLFGGREDGSTALIDEQVSYDYFSIGSILDRFVETPDFYVDETAGMREGTVLRLLLNYEFVNANSFTAGVSFDRGRTWHEQVVTPDEQGFSLIEFDGPHTGNTVRYRFRENDATGLFRWRSYSYEIIDAGDYIGTTTG